MSTIIRPTGRRRLLRAATLLPALAAGATMTTEATDAEAQPRPQDTLLMELKDGTVTIELRRDLAPRHCEQIAALAAEGFYDNTPFHRVIEGFMAQGGDPTGRGTGGSSRPNLRAEFSDPSRARFIRGTCGMARSQDPNSANSQFFIMFAPAPSLDGQYTIWGRVIAGMDAVDRIRRGDQARNGQVANPDRIVRMRPGAA
jgi:cyclophilin family peptidyl-prolyl cis-trans isomerase